MSSLTLSSGPAAEPLTKGELVAHLRLDPDSHDEDEYLDALILTARESVEAHTSRALINQTWVETLDDFPCGDQIVLPKAPLSSVTSITYVDTAGTTQTWAGANYVVNAPAGPRASEGTITLAYDALYPTVRSQRDAISITFIAGYGAAGSTVPGPIRHAMLLMIAELYERREEAIAGVSISSVPLSVSRLLASYVSGGW